MKLELELQKIIDDVAKDAEGKNWNDGEWTHQIKSRIAQLGKQKRYWIYASQSEHVDGGEWLFDLTWLNYSDNDLLEVELALESEWRLDHKEICDDFQKLILARAKLRAMIFQTNNLEEQKEIVSKLKRYIDRFARSQIGDNYLFSCWLIDKKQFVHQSYSYQKNNS